LVVKDFATVQRENAIFLQMLGLVGAAFHRFNKMQNTFVSVALLPTRWHFTERTQPTRLLSTDGEVVCSRQMADFTERSVTSR
jgi:hypothetical protein